MEMPRKGERDREREAGRGRLREVERKKAKGVGKKVKGKKLWGIVLHRDGPPGRATKNKVADR